MSLSFTAVADKEGKLVEYVYPLKTDGKAATPRRVLHHRHDQVAACHSEVYSPTHLIALKALGDKTVEFSFEKNQALLDKDFQLFYSTGDKDESA